MKESRGLEPRCRAGNRRGTASPVTHYSSESATRLNRARTISSIKEAQFLVRQCAEPSPAGQSVKAAIRRASRLLEISFTRTRDLRYGQARRITADEMDGLRLVAGQADFVRAIGLETLRNRLRLSSSPADKDVVERLTATIEAVAGKTARNGPVAGSSNGLGRL
jgi:hypothetical protein